MEAIDKLDKTGNKGAIMRKGIHIHYWNRKPQGKAISGYFRGIVAILCVLFLAVGPIQAEEDDIITQLIPFIIAAESGGNASAVSPAGCIGLMQINPQGALKEWNEKVIENQKHFLEYNDCETYDMPLTHYNLDNLFDKKINIRIGTWYLDYLKNHYLKEHFTVERLLASYNGGITRLKSVNYDVNKMSAETKSYVNKIMGMFKRGKNMTIPTEMECELYFIQFLFCKNRKLLLAENRGLYDALFRRYEKIYCLGKKNSVELFSINDRFVESLFGKL